MVEFMVFWPFALAFGLVAGSFINVVIYRIPNGISVSRGRSFCPYCNHQLSAMDLVPVLSYVFLRGRCRYCKAHISAAYPLIEALLGALFVLGLLFFGATLKTLLFALTCCVLTAASGIDIKTLELPDRFWIIIAAIGGVSFFSADLIWWERLAGAGAASVPLFVIFLVSKGEAMGFGDIKLMAAAGLLMGWKLSFFSLFAAIIIGGAAGAILMALRKKGKRDEIPFVPMLSAGVLFAMLFGNQILDWYFSLF